MESLELSTYVIEGGRIPPEDRDVIHSVLKKGVGRRIRIEIKEENDNRSNRQNRYYWKIVVGHVHAMFVAAGNDVTHQDVHDYLKQYVGQRLFVKRVRVDDRWETIVMSSAKLKVGQFSEWIEMIIAWAAERDLIIPLPGEEVLQ